MLHAPNPDRLGKDYVHPRSVFLVDSGLVRYSRIVTRRR
jgi:hypothetical protein